MADMMQRIGFMQGRLSPLVGERIQAFPGEAWAEEFSIARKYKIRNIEWTIDSLTFHSNPLIQQEAHERISRLARENSLKIPSVTCDYFMENPHWEPNGVDIEKDINQILEGMSQIGASILVIPLVDNSSIRNNPSLDLKFFTNMEEALDRFGIRVAFEVDLDDEDTKNFVANFSPKSYGINYDIGNSAAYGFNPEKEISKYGERIINVHVKDRFKSGITVPLGKGDADFLKVINQLTKKKYSGNFIMQTARAAEGDHAVELNRNIEYFMKYLNNG
ncbi:sugar phosphate isomerase/epimerase family protein [Candidatus Planktophila dulcis]|uniref:sugar phosphate isomerase/epimerase family protein n=1 Tax=Candidatus Planktophila dulcis TaxID=1884914 RepID=UPI003CF59529